MVVIVKEESVTDLFKNKVSELLAHYIEMAKDTAWKQHAWHRAKELARDCPSLYGEFPALLTAAMVEHKQGVGA